MLGCAASMPRWNCWLTTLCHRHGARLRAGNAQILLPRTMPACAVAIDGMKHGDGSHVKEANVLTEHAAVEWLAVHPAAKVAGQDSESAMVVIVAATAVSMRSWRHCQGVLDEH